MINEIINDPIQKAYVEKMISSPEIHRFVSNVVSDSPRIAIIVEQLTSEIREACVGLPNAHYIEFKTYVREDAENVRAHLFEPLYVREKMPKKVREKRDHYKSWENMLAWVDKNTSNIAKQLALDIKRKLKDVVDLPRGRHLCFYKGKPSIKSIFAAFVLTKKHLNVRIRTDPTTFRDPKKRVKEFARQYRLRNQ